MKCYVYFLLAGFLFTHIGFVFAQPPKPRKDIWQEPWEGVPEHYRRMEYPDLKFPSNLSDWKEQRIDISKTLLELLGNRHPRPEPLNVKTIIREERNGYIFEKFIFDNGYDSYVPGYLAIPTNVKGKVPVILALHGHGSSKDHIFGTGLSTQQSVMALLVANGFAVIAIDSYFNGERHGKGPAGTREMMEDRRDMENSLIKINLWFGHCLWGMQLRDEQIALDYLASRPEIDTERIGVQGMSMGSTRSWWLAAIDERIKAVVGVACFTRYKELIDQRYLRAHGIYYFVPGMLQHFDTEAVMGLIAPRPFLALTGDSDAGSPLNGMKVLEEKLNDVYSLYNANENFKSIIYKDTGHLYTDDMKMEMLNWFKKYLKP